LFFCSLPLYLPPEGGDVRRTEGGFIHKETP